MITDNPQFNWIYINPSNPDLPFKGELDFPRTKQEYLEHWGKWVLIESREKLDDLAAKLDPYVEERYIHCIKYNRAPEPYLELDGCAFLVFCDDRDRERVWKILADEGMTEKAWVYEKQTIEMWMPGGLIMEKLISYHKLNAEEAKKLSDETRQQHERWLSFMFEEGKKEEADYWNFEQLALSELNKTRLIEKIVAIEWDMFSKVQNIGGRASCQEDPKTFERMRSSQFSSWREDALMSYLHDLEKALKEKRNLLSEKYARMMKLSAPLEYERIKHMLPSLSPQAVPVVDQIVAIELEWQEEFSRKYPYVSGRGRPLYSRQDTPVVTSIETYARGELETYSLQTLVLRHRDILDKRLKKINEPETIHEQQVKKLGYESLEKAEEALKKLREGEREQLSEILEHVGVYEYRKSILVGPEEGRG